MFPNHMQLLQHMNQPRGHCITGRLLTNTRSFLFPDLSADSDVGGGEDDDDWQYISPEFDGSGFEEAPNFTGETQIGDPVLKSHMHLTQYVDQVCIICGSVKVTLCPPMSSVDGVCTCTTPSTHISVDLVIVL